MQTQELITIEPEIDGTGTGLALADASGGISNPALAYLLSLQSDNSRKTVQSNLNRFAGVAWNTTWDRAPWHTLRRTTALAVMYRLAQDSLAPATRNSCLSAVKSVMREAWLAKAISADDYQAIREIKGSKGVRVRTGRAIQKDEINALMAAVPATSTELLKKRNRAILAVLLGSGLRKTEACGLMTEHLDMADRSFRVIGKGDKEAVVFLHPEAIHYLEEWLAAKPEPTTYLFNPINRHGQIADRKLSASGMDHLLKQAALVAGVKTFAAHDTRRTYATRLFAAGVDAMKVRDAMRHASVETTQVYNMAAAEDLRKAIEAVDLL